MYRNQITLNSSRNLIISIEWTLIQITRDNKIEREFKYFCHDVAIKNFYKMAIMK